MADHLMIPLAVQLMTHNLVAGLHAGWLVTSQAWEESIQLQDVTTCYQRT